MIHATLAFVIAGLVALIGSTAGAQTLTIAGRDATKTYTRNELLADPATRQITIADPVYRRTMTYKAIPAAVLLKGAGPGTDDYVQARAVDNFSIGIPGSFFTSTGSAAPVEAFIAIEDPAVPWPPVPGKSETAGPFYLVWRIVPPAYVSAEFWAYRLAALSITDGPVERWPVLAVGAEVPAGDPIRTGLDRYVSLCIACHRFRGAGEGTQGPDLGEPMVPTQYFQIPALKKLIRDPASVRRLADEKMPGYDPQTLSDSDLDALIAWLAYKAEQPR